MLTEDVWTDGLFQHNYDELILITTYNILITSQVERDYVRD